MARGNVLETGCFFTAEDAGWYKRDGRRRALEKGVRVEAWIVALEATRGAAGQPQEFGLARAG